MGKSKVTNIIVGKTPKLAGTVKAPPSKSYTHRAIMVAGVNGTCRIINPLYSNDTLATINAWRKLGAVIKRERQSLRIKGCDRSPRLRGDSLNVGEAGTLLRFILPIIALANGKIKINGEGTLLDRSNKTIIDALRSWDINISGTGKDHKLPIILNGRGEIRGGITRVSGKDTSQAISSLLIAAPFAKNDTTIVVKDKLVSSPYVDVTIDILQKAGIKVKNQDYKRFYVKRGQQFKSQKRLVIHGDYSSASFLIAAASLIPSDVTITDLADDKQGDKKIISILNKMGAKIKRVKNTLKIKGPFKLSGINIDCGDIPDLVPILAVLGCFAEGKTKLYNIAHLANKESNRITAPAGELMKLGADIATTKNSIMIRQSRLKPGHVSSRDDHRIAMALVVAGLKIGNVRIRGAEAISKSYPNFLRDIKSLKAKINFMVPSQKVPPKVTRPLNWGRSTIPGLGS